MACTAIRSSSSIISVGMCAVARAFPTSKRTGGLRARRRLFRRHHGLPDEIRSGNSAPVASNSIHGLNRLNAWWLKLGIVHQRIAPASPQENGAHECMHRVLKAQATKPAAANAKLQQRVFNTVVHIYNEVRPHEALNNETPASRWQPSPTAADAHHAAQVSRPLPTTLHQYRRHDPPPPRSAVLTQAFNGEIIGFAKVRDFLWKVRHYDTLLGRFAAPSPARRRSGKTVNDVPGQSVTYLPDCTRHGAAVGVTPARGRRPSTPHTSAVWGGRIQPRLAGASFTTLQTRLPTVRCAPSAVSPSRAHPAPRVPPAQTRATVSSDEPAAGLLGEKGGHQCIRVAMPHCVF